MSKYSKSKYHKRAEELRAQDKKYCCGCKEIKPIDAFNKNKSNKDGLHGQCKACVKVRNKKSHEVLWADPKRKEKYQSVKTQWKEANTARYLYTQLRSRAKKAGIEFSIELSDLIFPTHCPVFGVALDYSRKGKRVNNSPSVDRIDNTQGYIKGNTQIISWRANRIKADSTVEELEKLLIYMKEKKDGVVTQTVGLRMD